MRPFRIPFFTFLLLCFCLLQQQDAQAQHSVNGRTETAKGEPVSGVSITVKQNENAPPYSFAISDAQGLFTLRLPAGYAGYIAEASHISFHKQSITLSASLQPLRFVLQQKQSVTLPEVIVKAPPIQKVGDTMKYRVSAFTNARDRVIGDVIDKIPGLQRNENGQILYQGRAINKYYIEGLDLMGSQYGLANESIRYELVEQVEIWERHQSMKVLDSTGAKNEVALNLKLTAKAKSVWNGNFAAGAGIPFFTGEGVANFMKFAPGFQTLSSLKLNNRGDNLLAQLTELTVNAEDWEQVAATATLRNSILSIPLPSFTFLSEKRRLLNETVMPAINILKTTPGKLQWRLNLQAFTDRTRNDVGNTQQFFLPTDTIVLQEFQDWRQRQRGLIATLQAEKNEKDVFLRIRSKTELRQTVQNSIITGSFPSSQQLRYPFLFTDNSIESIRKNKKKTGMINMKLTSRFFNTDSRLLIAPGIFEEVLNNNQPMNFVRQEVPVQSWWTNGRWGTQRINDKWNRQFFVKAEWIQDHFSSALYKDSAQKELQLDAPFRNRFTLSTISLQTGMAITRQLKQLNIQAELPVGWQWMLRNDRAAGSRLQQNLPLVLPSVNLSYRFGQFMARIQGKGAVSTAKWQQNFNNYITTDYRTVSAYSDSLLIQHSWYTGAGLNFSDPLKGMSAYVSVMQSYTLRNQLSSVVFNGIFTDQVFLPEKNWQRSFNIIAGMGQYIAKFKGGINFNGQYNRFHGPAIQNGKRFTFTNQTMGGKLKLYSRAISFMHLEAQSSLSISKSSSSLTGKVAPATIWQQQVQASFILVKNKLLLLTSGEWGASKQQGVNFPFSFYDATLSYRSKKVEWRLEALNLLNTGSFTMPFASQNQQQESYIRLRPATVLIKGIFLL